MLSQFNKYINAFEEGFIALILALMTLVTFWQVVLRYGFNTAGVVRCNLHESCLLG